MGAGCSILHWAGDPGLEYPRGRAEFFPNTPKRQALIENWQNFRLVCKSHSAFARSVPLRLNITGILSVWHVQHSDDATSSRVTPNQSQRLAYPSLAYLSYDTYADGIWKAQLTQHTSRTSHKFISTRNFLLGREGIRFSPCRSLTSCMHRPDNANQPRRQYDRDHSDDQVLDVTPSAWTR